MVKYSLPITLSVLLHASLPMVLVHAGPSNTDNDQFIFPPAGAVGTTYLNWNNPDRGIYHANDMLAVEFKSSVPNTTLKQRCCSKQGFKTRTGCELPQEVGVGVNNQNEYNMTLKKATEIFCYLRLEQPLRGQDVFIDSQEFDVMEPDVEPIFYTKDGSQPLEEAMMIERS